MSSRATLGGQNWPLESDTGTGNGSAHHVSPQLRFGITIGIYCLIFAMFFVCLASYPPVFERLVGGSDEMVRYHQTLLLEFTGFIMSHWWIPLLGSLLMGLASIVYSYRIFASMRRLEEALRQRQKDPFCKVDLRLRKGEYFHQFSTLLEEVLNAPVPPGPPLRQVQEDESRMELTGQP